MFEVYNVIYGYGLRRFRSLKDARQWITAKSGVYNLAQPLRIREIDA